MIHNIPTFSRSSFIRFGLFTLFSSFAAPMCSRETRHESKPKTVKASRIKTLAKGFNLGHWRLSKLSDGFYTKATLQQYQDLGLTYTRLPVLLSAFFNEDNPSVLKTDSLATLDAIIQMHVKTGLGITVCPFDPPPELYYDPAMQAKFVYFFKAFATHLNSTDPEKVFLEVMNEPVAATSQDWNNLQVQLITAIRSVAPNHTIIATSNDWSNVRALPMTQVVEDDNVVYNFHFYDPFIFTHQGATWAWRALQFMKNVPYPSNPAKVAPIVDTIQYAEAKGTVEHYGKENWNRDKLDSILAIAANWATNKGIPVICNEFGAIPWTTPRDSLLRYLKDVREVLDIYEIGWSHWFDLDIHDKTLIQALGLTPLPRS